MAFLEARQWRDTWFLSLLRPEWEKNQKSFCPRKEEVIALGDKVDTGGT